MNNLDITWWHVGITLFLCLILIAYALKECAKNSKEEHCK